MNDEFRLRCIGLIDDELIEVAINRMGKIKNERKVKVFSALVAAVLIIVVTPIGVLNYSRFVPNTTVDDSPFSEMPVIEIGNEYYQILSENSLAKYGLTEKPNSALINETLGTYNSVSGTIRVTVFTSTDFTTRNVLLGERDGKFFYMAFCNKINGEQFADAAEFLEFFGYNSVDDIVSMSVKGRKINSRETIEDFWNAILSSSIATIDDYDHAISQGEWTNDKAQESYNSSVIIELNVGTPNYLRIRFYSLTGFFVSHECYLKIA